MTGGGATTALHHHGDSALHRLPAEAKLVAVVLFVLAVVATPREAIWAFGVHACTLLGIASIGAGLPWRLVLRRMRIEVPFVAFALLLPLVGGPPHTSVLGLGLSEPGLWAAWAIIAKGAIGVLAAIVLGATTPVAELLVGLQRLRLPAVVTGIASFMVRYLDVIVDDASRMRIARASRGYDPRWIWQARAIAGTAGTLFIRSYERGERVHLAMLSRGYVGTMPELHVHPPVPRAWIMAMSLPLWSSAVMAVALAVR